MKDNPAQVEMVKSIVKGLQDRCQVLDNEITKRSEQLSLCEVALNAANARIAALAGQVDWFSRQLSQQRLQYEARIARLIAAGDAMASLLAGSLEGEDDRPFWDTVAAWYTAKEQPCPDAS